ncbi:MULTISPECIES: hypothetical protein [Pacificibacter]|uniref:hypothetical protein n=1 Tax=Pacificibacter TaxID=1042323 RepID=UPI001C0A329E|nr:MULTISPECIES: hypothetical protein [Pacificibacter]MBU2936557.1 hypothetical protein [Pacificibacter marinus]MDO6614641.1 hypothetical protein [Pacificibacter sp. 1_MG-2023]
MKFGVYLVFAGAFGITQAQAGCPQGQEAFTSCQIEGRETEVFVCFDDQIATYSYGPIGGAPELQLSEPIERVDFEPWSGAGQSIFESVTFYNGDYAYNVGGGFDRPFSEEDMEHGPRRFGWVEVTESGEHAASLECIPETVSYGFGGGIHDIKVAAGQTWDPYSYTWVSDRIQPTATSTLQETSYESVIEYCLPASEFNLGGVHMGDPLGTLGKLGSPETIEDPDGRGEAIDRMMLVGMDIDIFQDAVFAMSTTSPHWEMPSGLRVGLTRGEVIRLLGRVPNGYTSTSQRFTAYVCSDIPVPDPEWTMMIDFGQDKRVSRIDFVSLAY